LHFALQLLSWLATWLCFLFFSSFRRGKVNNDIIETQTF